METKWQKLIMWLSVVGLSVIFGCASFQDVLTPCYIPKEVIESTDVNVPLIPIIPYTSLFDAKYVKTKMYYQYLLYGSLLDGSIRSSELFQEKLFSPEGPIGLLFPAIFGGTLGALLISKPSDKKEIEKLKNGNVI